MVDQNILKLELKRLRDMLNERADEVFDLEKRRLQLETVSDFFLLFESSIVLFVVESFLLKTVNSVVNHTLLYMLKPTSSDFVIIKNVRLISLLLIICKHLILDIRFYS